MNKKCILFRYVVGIPMFLLGAGLANLVPILGMISFLLLILIETGITYIESKRFLDFRILFSVSWLFGLSLSTLKLSKLQSVWGFKTWAAFFLMYFMLLLGYDIAKIIIGKIKFKEKKREPLDESLQMKRILQAILVIFSLGMLSFFIESVKFHFVFPILSDVPHAYTEFHITGIHYFVVSLMFVHPLSVIYLMKNKDLQKKNVILIAVLNFFAILVPFLLLSKFQLLLSLSLPVLTFVLIQTKIKKKVLFIISVILIILAALLFAFMVSRRHYPEGYLEKIFQFKNRNTPMGIQYTYMYIVNNLENVNMLVNNLQHHSFGIRELFPVFALTGLKFIPSVKELLLVESYITIEELTTTSIIYDAYGDFGLIGVSCFGLILGFVGSVITEMYVRRQTVFSVLMVVQFSIYMTLAFFSTWFSNPTTWFWFAVTLLTGLFVTKPKKKMKVYFSEL